MSTFDPRAQIKGARDTRDYYNIVYSPRFARGNNFGWTFRRPNATEMHTWAARKNAEATPHRTNFENSSLCLSFRSVLDSGLSLASEIFECKRMAKQSVAIKFIDPTTCNVAMWRSENRTMPRPNRKVVVSRLYVPSTCVLHRIFLPGDRCAGKMKWTSADGFV